jgi:hypothetical protein
MGTYPKGSDGMSKQSYSADAMRDAMEIACQIHIDNRDNKYIPTSPGRDQLIRERRIPYSDPVFQGAYAAICIERDLPNQYITINMG